jgi:hypothetical protein
MHTREHTNEQLITHIPMIGLELQVRPEVAEVVRVGGAVVAGARAEENVVLLARAAAKEEPE